VECGIESDELSSSHGANSFIHILFFKPIVKDELAVLQRRTAVKLPAETRITFTFCYRFGFSFFSFCDSVRGIESGCVFLVWFQ
jgi:hypothetical protein